MKRSRALFASLSIAVVVATASSVLAGGAMTASAASSPARSYVTALYNDYLTRAPSAGDLSGWAASLDAGAPRSSVSTGFADSDEYRLIRIDNAYQTILGRPGEQAGRLNWLDGMHRGILGTDDVEKSFYESTEFYNRSGGNDLSWVDGLYKQVLGRDASFSEEVFWVQAGSHGVPGPGGFTSFVLDRTFVTNQIYGAVEAARSRVSAMYSHYLGRTPDENGVVQWANYDLQHGDAAVRSGLSSSDEYYALASTRFPSV